MPRWIFFGFRTIYIINSVSENFVGMRSLVFNKKLDSYEISKPKLIYFIIFNGCLVSYFPVSVYRIFSSLPLNHNRLVTFTLFVMTISHFIICLTMLVRHLKDLTRRRDMLNQSMKFFNQVRDMLMDYESDLKIVLWFIYLRIGICQICSIILTLTNINEVVNAFNYQLMIHFIIVSIPYLIQNAILSNFFAALLRIYFFFRQINRNLEHVAQKLKDNRDLTEYQRITLCCELSDFVDRLAISHRSLCQSTKDLLYLYSLQILFCLLTLFFGIVFQTYLVVLWIKLFFGGLFDGISGSLSATFFIVTSFAELLLQGIVSSKLNFESERAGKLLHKISVVNTDMRLQRSVSFFFTNYSVKICYGAILSGTHIFSTNYSGGRKNNHLWLFQS